MKKTIRVVKLKDGFIETSQYSQGEFSYRLTDDVLKAENLNDMEDKGAFTIRCCATRTVNPTIEEYVVTVRKIS